MAKTDEQRIQETLDKEALSKMPVKHAQAILMLAQGISQAQVAEILGVHHNTVWRWLKNNEFADLVANARAVMFEGTMNLISEKSMDMVNILSGIAGNSPDIRGRVNAASKILDLQLQAKQLEVEQQLEEMRSQIAALTEEIRLLREEKTEVIDAQATEIYD